MQAAGITNINATFLKVVASGIVDKYIGESARIIREMFAFARDHEPCVIFMDEIDAIGGSRFSEGTSADREIQRTLMELLNQMDGFESQGAVKMVMATNRPDILDPALLRPGRLDRKIEIPEPNETQRLEMSRTLAQRLLHEGEDDTQRLNLLFTLLACREPTTGEREACAKLLAAMRERYVGAADDAVALLSVGDAPRDENLDPADHAAWTQVAVTVLASDVAILLY